MRARRSPARARGALAAGLLAVSLAAGCYNNYYIYGDPSDRLEVQVHVPSPTPDYLSYQTFSFNEPDIEIPVEMQAYEDAIRGELMENMEHRGFVYDSAAPELVFNLYANIDPSSPEFSGYYCDATYAEYYPCAYYGDISYGYGTLVLGLVETGQPEEDVWTAVIEGVFFEGESEETIVRRIRNNIDVAFDLSPGGIREGHP